MFNLHDVYTKGSRYVLYDNAKHYAYVELTKVHEYEEAESMFMTMLEGKKWFLEVFDINGVPKRNEYLLVMNRFTFCAYRIYTRNDEDEYAKYTLLTPHYSIRDTIQEVFDHSFLESISTEHRLLANEIETMIYQSTESFEDYIEFRGDENQ